MHWGTVTWLFFHTIAEKIKENEFNNKKEQILNIIRYLLESLPCPLCKNHAMRTIVRNPLNKIQSKEHLKLYFFNFHNEVNKRRSIPLADITVLDKYKNANLIGIIRGLNLYFKTSAPQLMADQMHRRNRLIIINNILKSNMHIFDL